jgi:anhydro-N-acetylmuramic acid kinase
MELGGLDLMMLHRDFGRFTGEMLNGFLEDAREKPGIIASHGHTVFHQPEKGLTLQIGDGAEIAAITGITTVCDFRRLDVALGGQGAPLVPVGDELLFGQYTYCLNLGGFANVSFRERGKRVAFDICPVNIVLNRLARVWVTNTMTGEGWPRPGQWLKAVERT